ncbi:hypothetical protein AAES_78364 [Amazona aestiva]|uniref:Uncharacterized protein n=1 Tax=Amazona aestiva TaxID=12930 RepID=A0A0Q3USL4_AMAAE|nr:hypothetical protein AAES_78364 [Amazona aestiva]
MYHSRLCFCQSQQKLGSELPGYIRITAGGFEPISAQPVALPAWRGGSVAGLKTKNLVLVFPSEQDSFFPPSREQRCKLSQQQGFIEGQALGQLMPDKLSLQSRCHILR